MEGEWELEEGGWEVEGEWVLEEGEVGNGSWRRGDGRGWRENGSWRRGK